MGTIKLAPTVIPRSQPQGTSGHVRSMPPTSKMMNREMVSVVTMIIVTTITFALFVILLVGGMLLTWPEVPWGWLLGITIGANLIVPIVAYARSKTIWLALDLSWHPLEPAEIETARSAVATPD